MADCNKTIDFIEEQQRMCKSYSNCGQCSFGGSGLVSDYCYDYIFTHPYESILAVQEWSEKNPIDYKAESERLKKELGEAKKEIIQLRKEMLRTQKNEIQTEKDPLGF